MRRVVTSSVVAFTLSLAPMVARADSAYTVKVEAPAVQKGAPAKAIIHIAPGSGFHMNKEYPTSVALTAPGVALWKPKLTQADKDVMKMEDKGFDIEVRYIANEPGQKTFDGELKFAVCSANSCDPKKEKLHFTVEVK